MGQCVHILYVSGMYVGCMYVVLLSVIMFQDHRYLEPPDPRRTETFRVNSQHPNSQPPHTFNSVQNCVLSLTTSSQ